MEQIALADLKNEVRTTRKLLKRVPEEKFGWKPHPKSWTLGELSTHIANLFSWHEGILLQDSFDLATVGPPKTMVQTSEELLELFDSEVEKMNRVIRTLDEKELLKNWTLQHGDNVVTERPKLLAFRMTCVSHLIHHRGQLTVYLRLLDVPLPPVYGPTADEQVSWQS